MAGRRRREEGSADGLAYAVKPDGVFQLRAERIAGLFGLGAGGGVGDPLERGAEAEREIGLNRGGLGGKRYSKNGQNDRPHTPLRRRRTRYR